MENEQVEDEFPLGHPLHPLKTDNPENDISQSASIQYLYSREELFHIRFSALAQYTPQIQLEELRRDRVRLFSFLSTLVIFSCRCFILV